MPLNPPYMKQSSETTADKTLQVSVYELYSYPLVSYSYLSFIQLLPFCALAHIYPHLIDMCHFQNHGIAILQEHYLFNVLKSR